MAHGPIPDPKHDGESLALEEQFGIPMLIRDFGAEGRLVIALDDRKVQRELNATAARLDAFCSRRKAPPS